MVELMTLTVEEMATQLHLSRTTAYQLAESPGFPTLRIGNKILINRAGLQRWIDQQSGMCYNNTSNLEN